MPLFKLESFKSASGNILPFKIECDALTDVDLKCIGYLIEQHIKYSNNMGNTYKDIIGIPTGGARLLKYVDIDNLVTKSSEYILLIDDVLTTGSTINKFILNNNITSNYEILVLFDRSGSDDFNYYVESIFKVNEIVCTQ